MMLGIKVGYDCRNIVSPGVALLPRAAVMDPRGECQRNLIGLQFNFDCVCRSGSNRVCLPV